MSRKFKISMLLLMLASLSVFEQAYGQSGPGKDGSVQLRAEQSKLNRLASDKKNDEATFNIDGASTINIEIVASIETLETSIVTPSGQTITPTSVAGIGGEFNATGGLATPNSFLIIPSFTGNFHYTYTFPAQGAGSYVVRFAAPANLSQEVVVLTRATWDSAIVTRLFSAEPVVKTGSPLILTAAVFKGTTPVQNVTVETTIIDAAKNRTTLSLLDNGPNNTDDKTGDGLYSGVFTPANVGRYSVSARITGTVDGTTFTRIALTELEAVAPKGLLSGAIQDRGVDDNSDGLLDRIAFNVGTQITTAGTYQAFVHLRTSSGKTLVGSGRASQSSGSGVIEASIAADAIRDANEDGPYTIDLVELEFIDPTEGNEAADRRRDLGQTNTYLVSQFQRRPLLLTGSFSEQGIDTNGNGKFERLRVTIQVDVLIAGSYDWTVKLSDAGFSQIDVAAGSGQLNAGLQNITVEFDGVKIGTAGVRGPYVINDLLLFGPRSLVTTEIGQTRPYGPEQFEGGQPSQISLVLTPDFVVNLHTGTSHTLSVLLTSSGSPLANQNVNFRITDGPNLGQLFAAQTNAQGVATLTYSSLSPGTDKIDVTYVDSQSRTRISNQAIAGWIENATLGLTPSTTSQFIGTNATLTATVLNSGTPVPSATVSFSVVDGPNTGRQFSAQTNAQGIATASYSGTLTGTDRVIATVAIGSAVLTSNQVTVIWFSNRAPICTSAAPSVAVITPPDRSFVPVNVQGISDPDNDPLTITINSIRQDEPVDHIGDGSFAPDGVINGSTARLRAESIVGTVNAGNTQIVGNGRFYHIGFTARDPLGATCTGVVKVAVPHVRTATPVDGGPLFDSTAGASGNNPLNNAQFFVQQHYYDYLNREPDPAGLDFWTREITQCGIDEQCVEVKRINVSAAFFFSMEFEATGGFAIRVQRAAFGRKSSEASSRISYAQFTADSRFIGNGVVQGQAGSQAQLDSNRAAYIHQVVTSPQFVSSHPLNMTPDQYVDALFATAGISPTSTEHANAMSAYSAGGRESALMVVSDSESLKEVEFRPSFVLLQYFGYLRRNPTDAPDNNDSGYQFWLNKLNNFNGNFQQAEMVKAFLLSSEFRSRFAVPEN